MKPGDQVKLKDDMFSPIMVVTGKIITRFKNKDEVTICCTWFANNGTLQNDNLSESILEIVNEQNSNNDKKGLK